MISFDGFTDMVAVPNELDFVRSAPAAQIPLLLRFHTLFSGRVMLPDTFLLHNREFLTVWNGRESRDDLRRFFAEGAPVVSMGGAEHLSTFANHYQASTDANNPSVIPVEIGGGEYAADLDDITQGAEFRRYEHVERLHAFPDLFLKEAKRVHLDLDIAKHTLLKAKEVSDGEKGAQDRQRIDGYSGVTRSGLIRLFRSIPAVEIRNRAGQIWECARLAYARNVALPLQCPWQESQIPATHRDQLDRSIVYELRDEDDLFNRLRWSSGTDPYRINWGKLQAAPWSRIRKIVDTEGSPGKEFLLCKKNLLAVREYGNLDSLAEALCRYLHYLAGVFPAAGSPSPTRVALKSLGAFLVVELALELLEINLRATIAVILGTYLLRRHLPDPRGKELETEGPAPKIGAQMHKSGAINLLASQRWPEDHHKTWNQQR